MLYLDKNSARRKMEIPFGASSMHTISISLIFGELCVKYGKSLPAQEILFEGSS